MTKIKEKSRHLFLSMILGDGNLDKYGQLRVQHCEKQKDYLEWKAKLLRKSGIKTSEIKFLTSNGFPAYRFTTNVYKFTKLYRKILYRPVKKIANRKQLNKLNALGLAI